MTLYKVINSGLKEAAYSEAKEMIKTVSPMEVINEGLISALDNVGKGFEQGTVFLP